MDSTMMLDLLPILTNLKTVTVSFLKIHALTHFLIGSIAWFEPQNLWKCMYIQNIYHVDSTLIGRALDRRKVFAWTDFVFEQNYGV